MSSSTEPSTGSPPTYYRHRGIARRLVPDTWGSVHGWIFVVFLVATFGPMFHWWADSPALVAGWPISIGWILGWMVLQTVNLVVFYFTTVRPTAGRIAVETGAAPEDRS